MTRARMASSTYPCFVSFTCHGHDKLLDVAFLVDRSLTQGAIDCVSVGMTFGGLLIGVTVVSGLIKALTDHGVITDLRSV